MKIIPDLEILYFYIHIQPAIIYDIIVSRIKIKKNGFDYKATIKVLVNVFVFKVNFIVLAVAN